MEKRAAFETRDLWRATLARAVRRPPARASDDASRHRSATDADRSTGARAVVRAVAIGIRGNVDAPDVSRNHLGFLPTHVSECVRLRYLDVSHNELLFLPDVARLASLADPRASGNRLQKLPDSLSACVSLRSLYAGQNPELDALPNLEPCVSLETLVVDRCALKVLPVSVAAAPRLTRCTWRGTRADVPRPGGVRAGGTPRCSGSSETCVAPRRSAREMRARARRSGRGRRRRKRRKRRKNLWALCFGATRARGRARRHRAGRAPRARGRRVRRRKRAASRARDDRGRARGGGGVAPRRLRRRARGGARPRSFPGTTCRVAWRRCGLCANTRRSRDVCLLNSPRWPRTF